jgi:hypothetical protein
MKNVVFWDMILCGSCKNRRLISVTRIGDLLVTAKVVLSPQILLTPMVEVILSYKMHSVSHPTRRHYSALNSFGTHLPCHCFHGWKQCKIHFFSKCICTSTSAGACD